MYQFTQFPKWIITLFALFCLFQVQNWFEEIIRSFSADRKSFLLKGQRFHVLPNRSFIVDESLKAYGIHLNYSHQLN